MIRHSNLMEAVGWTCWMFFFKLHISCSTEAKGKGRCACLPVEKKSRRCCLWLLLKKSGIMRGCMVPSGPGSAWSDWERLEGVGIARELMRRLELHLVSLQKVCLGDTKTEDLAGGGPQIGAGRGMPRRAQNNGPFG